MLHSSHDDAFQVLINAAKGQDLHDEITQLEKLNLSDELKILKECIFTMLKDSEIYPDELSYAAWYTATIVHQSFDRNDQHANAATITALINAIYENLSTFNKNNAAHIEFTLLALKAHLNINTFLNKMLPLNTRDKEAIFHAITYLSDNQFESQDIMNFLDHYVEYREKSASEDPFNPLQEVCEFYLTLKEKKIPLDGLNTEDFLINSSKLSLLKANLYQLEGDYHLGDILLSHILDKLKEKQGIFSKLAGAVHGLIQTIKDIYEKLDLKINENNVDKILECFTVPDDKNPILILLSIEIDKDETKYLIDLFLRAKDVDDAQNKINTSIKIKEILGMPSLLKLPLLKLLNQNQDQLGLVFLLLTHGSSLEKISSYVSIINQHENTSENNEILGKMLINLEKCGCVLSLTLLNKIQESNVFSTLLLCTQIFLKEGLSLHEINYLMNEMIFDKNNRDQALDLAQSAIKLKVILNTESLTDEPIPHWISTHKSYLVKAIKIATDLAPINGQSPQDNLLKILNHQNPAFVVDRIYPFVSGFGNIKYEDGLLNFAQLAARKSYGINVTILKEEDFNNYLIFLKTQAPPLREAFIVIGNSKVLHWIAGEIELNKGNNVKVAFIDSLDPNQYSYYALDHCVSKFNKTFQDCSVKILLDSETRLKSLGCSVMSMDDAKHLLTLNAYLPPEDRDGGLIRYMENHRLNKSIQIAQVSVELCDLPLPLIRASMYETHIDKRLKMGVFSELHTPMNKKGQLPGEIKDTFEMQSSQKKFNQQLQRQLQKMAKANFEYLIKTPEPTVREQMQQFSFEGFKERKAIELNKREMLPRKPQC